MNKKLKILLVDDSDSIRGLVSGMLIKNGFTNLIEATDGQKALDKIIELMKGKKVELILSDYEMPNMTGAEFFKRLKEDKTLSQIPFVMISSRGEMEKILEMAQMGLKYFIVKPVEETKLISTIKSIID